METTNTMDHAELRRLAAKIGPAKKHFGRRARETAGRDDLTQADYQALHAEADRQEQVRIARKALRPRSRDPLADGALGLQRRLDYQRTTAKIDARQAETKLRAAIRRAIQSELRRACYTLERSDGGSNYYTKWDDNTNQQVTVRLSDHAVPLTPEREYNESLGQCSWAHRDYLDVSDYESVKAARTAAREFVGEAEVAA